MARPVTVGPGSLYVQLGPELRERVLDEADYRDVSAAELVRMALRAFLDAELRERQELAAQARRRAAGGRPSTVRR